MQYAGVRVVKKQIKTPKGFTEDTSNLNASPNSNTINFSYHYKLEIVPELIISDLRPNSPAVNAGTSNW